MGAAVGMIEVKGLPPALAVADAMVKAGRVTLVEMEKVSPARYTVIVRGDVSEVKAAMDAGLESVKKVTVMNEENLLLSHHYIPRPDENVETVLPIHYSDRVAQFYI